MSKIYVAFEGIDGSGKTTQCNLLQCALENHGKIKTMKHLDKTHVVRGKIKEIIFSNPDLPADIDSTLSYMDWVIYIDNLDTGSICISDRIGIISSYVYFEACKIGANNILSDEQRSVIYKSIKPLLDTTGFSTWAFQELDKCISDIRDSKDNEFSTLSPNTKIQERCKIFTDKYRSVLQISGKKTPDLLVILYPPFDKLVVRLGSREQESRFDMTNDEWYVKRYNFYKILIEMLPDYYTGEYMVFTENIHPEIISQTILSRLIRQTS